MNAHKVSGTRNWDRARGLFQFYGANRTGRFSGRGIQLQNLPQHSSTLEEARQLVKAGCFEGVELLYGNTPDVLSQLIRTMLIPKPGCEFIISDFSAIEARVLAWEAVEQWRLDAFQSGKDIYCESASQMFHAGGRALKFTSQTMKGVPDRLVLLLGGKCAFVELKAPGKQMTI